MLDAKFYDTLSRLKLHMSHKSSLNLTGNRKSVQKGSSAEFSDFREYRPGDDLRRMDWNAYARLDKLYIRQYMEEKEAVVSVLVDTSASMDYGEKSKAELARDLAAAVSFLALNNMDRLYLYDMKDPNRCLSAGGGKNAFPRVLRWLEGLEFSGETDMLSAARQMQGHGPGVTVIVSDFLHPDMLPEEEPGAAGKTNRDGRARTAQEKAEGKGPSSYEKLLRYLIYCRQRPVILHTLAAEELRVTLAGAYNLIDAENGSRLRLTVDAKTVDSYERQLRQLVERMKKGCAACGGAYVLCDAGKDRGELIFQDLREIYDI
ncbi:MAG: DUF58 domain-containing protein [bacterium]|nr:DUF58 domain-containing protein [bacterium]